MNPETFVGGTRVPIVAEATTKSRSSKFGSGHSVRGTHTSHQGRCAVLVRSLWFRLRLVPVHGAPGPV